MTAGSVFFQHPIGMWRAEPYKTFSDRLGAVGRGIYWDVFEQVRLGRGIDSLDHILSLYDNVKPKQTRLSLQKKLRMALSSEYNLFFVNAQRMVTIVDHTKAIREENRRRLEGPGLFDDYDWEQNINFL